MISAFILVCFRNISPPRSACTSPIYSRDPPSADWFHPIPLHLFLRPRPAAVQPCTVLYMHLSRSERLRFNTRLLPFSFACPLFAISPSALYSYTKYFTIAFDHYLSSFHCCLCDWFCLCMTLRNTCIRPCDWS